MQAFCVEPAWFHAAVFCFPLLSLCNVSDAACALCVSVFCSLQSVSVLVSVPHPRVPQVFTLDSGESTNVRPNAALALQFMVMAASRTPPQSVPHQGLCRGVQRLRLAERLVQEGLAVPTAPRDCVTYWTYLVETVQCLMEMQVDPSR